MKKVFIVLGLIFGCKVLHANVINHILPIQYHVWKSSALETGDYAGTQIATSPIIFHTVIGSGTVNVSPSAFTLLQSTGMTSMSTDASTKAYIPLDSAGSGIRSSDYDILVTTHSYFNKVGPSRVQYLWDYLDNGASFNRFPKD